MPSGIPDFRSPGTGLWEKVDPMEVAHIDAFQRDPKRFWDFYRPRFADARRQAARTARTRRSPSSSAAGCSTAVITQNIDRLHSQGGLASG